MKDRLNVLKSEAKQISIMDGLLSKHMTLYFIDDDLNFKLQDWFKDRSLESDNLYKDYEWVLTPVSDLKQGQIVKDDELILIFDKIMLHTNTFIVWHIKENRPAKRYLIGKNYFKLCKKV